MPLKRARAVSRNIKRRGCRGGSLVKRNPVGKRTAAENNRRQQRPSEERAMPLFPCSKCNCIEDTALSHYWSARLRQKAAVCSACDPTIGKWHGEFPRESAQDWVTDRSGLLLDKGSVQRWPGQPGATFAR